MLHATAPLKKELIVKNDIIELQERCDIEYETKSISINRWPEFNDLGDSNKLYSKSSTCS